jgi:hypothetical protein
MLINTRASNTQIYAQGRTCGTMQELEVEIEDEYVFVSRVQNVGPNSASPFGEAMHACILVHKRHPLVAKPSSSSAQASPAWPAL